MAWAVTGIPSMVVLAPQAFSRVMVIVPLSTTGMVMT
jgi:hypothetical protein